MGKVYLVGAGPGSLDLLTVRAMRLVASADVILYDALVGHDILQLASPKARLINVGKRRGKKSFEQEDINTLLVYSAQTADTVVRLKGGDPMVFGRAAEEMNALRRAGIEFEVVPGVTAACSAAAVAKISLTDRRLSSEVTFTTAHHCDNNADVPWIEALNPNRTVVIYMPGTDYERITAQLLSAGVPAATPCVVVSRIASENQQVLATAVGQLASFTSLPAPAVIVVGEVARTCEQPEREGVLTRIQQEAERVVRIAAR